MSQDTAYKRSDSIHLLRERIPEWFRVNLFSFFSLYSQLISLSFQPNADSPFPGKKDIATLYTTVS